MSKIILLGRHPMNESLPDVFCFDVPEAVSTEEVIETFREGLFEADYTHRIDPVSYAAEYVCERIGASVETLRPDGEIVYEDE